MKIMLSMHWFRRRQRDLPRVGLALFCLAWLQAAAVPCAMADEPPAPAAHHDCEYCPPADQAPASGHQHGSCVYPHAPQVDSRAAAGFVFVAPVVPVLVTLDQAEVAVPVPDPDTPAVVPRPRLSVSYCRFIE